MPRLENKRAYVFAGDLLNPQESDSLFEVLEYLQQKDYACYVSYLNHLFIDNWYKLMQFHSPINQVPFYMFQKRYSYYTIEEDRTMTSIRNKLSKNQVLSEDDWNCIAQIGKREYKRFLYENKFDVYIRYSGQDIESLKFFIVFEGKKVLVIHQRMLEKAQKNYEYYVYLTQAMKIADVIYYANQETFEAMEDLYSDVRCKKIVKHLY